MSDLELLEDEASLEEVAETTAVADNEATPEVGEGEGDGGEKVFRGAHTSKDPKEIIKRVQAYEPHLQAAAKRFGVKVEHLRAIMAQESGGNANADANPKKRVASAAGLMQVTGETWKQMQSLHKDLAPYDFQTYKYNPKINCLFGAATLASKQGILIAAGMSKDSAHFAQLMVAAYNGGEGVVKAAIAHARAAGSKDPEGDALKEEHLVPAIGKFPSVYNYYLTGGGKKSNKSGSREEAIKLKFREISKYPAGVTKFMAAQREMGLLGGKTEGGQTEQKTEPKTEGGQTEQKTEPKTEGGQTEQVPLARKGDLVPFEPEKYLGATLAGSVGKGGDNQRAEVIAVQTRLRFSGIETGLLDGRYGPRTAAAILEFQKHFLREPDGLIEPGKRTAKELFLGSTEVVSAKVNGEETLTQPKPEGSKDREDDQDKVSAKGAQQLQRLVSTAAQAAGGKRPAGRCYAAVKRHISNAGGYGNIRNIYNDARFQPQGLARNFAEVVNSKGPESFGLERLSIANPYDAPEGSLIVVSPGSPGTRHPTAGDITVRGPGDHFYNDGEMKYGGPKAWPHRTGRVLGVYRVK